NHKFVSGMAKVDPDARLYRKSGTWRTYHSDSAIIEHDDKRYILVALANDANGGKWLEKIVVEMDRLVTETEPRIQVATAP
ncbi:MAG: serine hydrolase, partial [Pseudomonadota bacterium]